MSATARSSASQRNHAKLKPPSALDDGNSNKTRKMSSACVRLRGPPQYEIMIPFFLLLALGDEITHTVLFNAGVREFSLHYLWDLRSATAQKNCCWRDHRGGSEFLLPAGWVSWKKIVFRFLSRRGGQTKERRAQRHEDNHISDCRKVAAAIVFRTYDREGLVLSWKKGEMWKC